MTPLLFCLLIQKQSKGMQCYARERLLRTNRFSRPGHSYLVTCVVKDRNPVFTDIHTGRMVVSEMKRLHQAGVVHSLAWVIMPDHVHWLFELKSGSLATLMQSLKGSSAFAINKVYGTKKLTWQKGYHDRRVRVEEDLAQMARYVIANPLRAGLVEHQGDYPLWDCEWTWDRL
jgi:REP element-mobilizing transposase RayT